MGYSIAVLNNIRMNASQEYKDRIPKATQSNINAIGQAFQNYNLVFNEFLSNLFNRIGKTVLEQKMFKNRLARFKSGTITNQQDVEEIFIGMAKAEGSYDKNGTNPLGRRAPVEIDVWYHRMNRQDYYAISIGDLDFRRVFQSESTLDEFIRAQINAVYSADQYDEWLAMKNVMATYRSKDGAFDGYFHYEVSEMGDDKEKWAKEYIKAIRKAVQDFSFPSTLYNPAGVKTWCDPSDLVLFVNKDVLVEVDVERLATAFHTSHTDQKVVPTIIPMDDFGSLGNVYSLLVDKNWFKVWDTLSHMESQRNAHGLFTNYFYHHHQILSASMFKNAAKFAPPTPEP